MSPPTARVRPQIAVDARGRPRYAYLDAEVVTVEVLGPHWNRITLHADGVAEFPFGLPDQWLKLFFPVRGTDTVVLPMLSPGELVLSEDDAAGWYQEYLRLPDDVRPPMRTYTVRSFDRAAQTFVVDFVLHGEDDNTGGPGSGWAARAMPGQRIGVFGPGGAYSPDERTEWILLVGDETALPAIAAILATDPDEPVHVVVEVESATDELALPTRARDVVHWVHREGPDRPGRTVLVDALAGVALPDGTPYVWLAGEAAKVKSTRRHLIGARGIDRRRITFVGYWRRGRSEDSPETEAEAAGWAAGDEPATSPTTDA